MGWMGLTGGIFFGKVVTRALPRPPYSLVLSQRSTGSFLRLGVASPSYTVVRLRPTPVSFLIMIHRSTTPPYCCAQGTAGEEQRAWVGGPVQVDMRPSRTGGGGMHVAEGMKEQDICKA
jgi:hypothetical protein